MMCPDDALGLTQRELLLEMRDDLRILRNELTVIARDQIIAAERRAGLTTSNTAICVRLDSHEKALLDLQKWRDEASGAIKLARWALGASLLASVLVVLEMLGIIGGIVPR